MLEDGTSALDARFGVGERAIEGRASDPGRHCPDRRIESAATALDVGGIGCALGNHVAARDADLVEENLTLWQSAESMLVEGTAARNSGKIERHEAYATVVQPVARAELHVDNGHGCDGCVGHPGGLLAAEDPRVSVAPCDQVAAAFYFEVGAHHAQMVGAVIRLRDRPASDNRGARLAEVRRRELGDQLAIAGRECGPGRTI